MSVHVSSWVWRHTKSLRAELRLVLVRLADIANDEGFAYPSMTTLAEDVNKSRRQIINDIDTLVSLGLITKERRADRSGRSTSNLYRVVMTAQPDVGRVKPIAPSQGEAHCTLPVKPASPSQCSPLHPPKGEPSIEPSIEPTPPSPLPGGEVRSAKRAAEDGVQQLRERVWREHKFQAKRPALREWRARLRAGETVAEIWESLQPQLARITAPPPPAWDPPASDENAEKLWALIRARVRASDRVSAHSYVTWLAPLRAVHLGPPKGTRPVRLVLASPTSDSADWVSRNYSDLVNTAAESHGAVVSFWRPEAKAA